MSSPVCNIWCHHCFFKKVIFGRCIVITHWDFSLRSLVVKKVSIFHVLICHLYIPLVKMSVYIFCPFSSWILLNVEFWKFFSLDMDLLLQVDQIICWFLGCGAEVGLAMWVCCLWRCMRPHQYVVAGWRGGLGSRGGL